MKLQAELTNVTDKFLEHKEEIRQYAENLKASGQYKDFETRLAWDVLSALFGSAWVCELYRKYDCNDTHITTLAKSALKAILIGEV